MMFPWGFSCFLLLLKLPISKPLCAEITSNKGTTNNQITITYKRGYSLEQEIQYKLINIHI